MSVSLYGVLLWLLDHLLSAERKLQRISENLPGAVLPLAFVDDFLTLIDKCLSNLRQLLMTQFVLAVCKIFTCHRLAM